MVLPKDKKSQMSTLSLVTGLKKDVVVSEFPVSLAPPRSYADFFPEGGYQVQGISSRVGFKIVDENGRGVRAVGDVLDEQSKSVAKFYTYYEGMGAFEFTPQAGRKYRSRVITAGADTIIQDFPEAIKVGSVLEVQTASVADSIIMVIRRSPNSMSEPLGILVQNGNRPVSQMLLSGGQAVTRFSLHRKVFPSGVSQITLFNSRGVPLSERLVFVNNYKGLRINVTPEKEKFQAREKVALNLTAADASGRPVQGEFSVSVMDLDQVPDSTLRENNILTHMLLSSEIKGYVLQPGYYFRDTTMRRRLALEYLLMTQGWRRYRWESALRSDSLAYEFEPGIPIEGQVKNITFGTPLKNFKITMAIGTPVDSIMTDRADQPKKWGWQVPKTGLLGTDTIYRAFVRGMKLKDYGVTFANDTGIFRLYSRVPGKETLVLQTQRYAGPIEKRVDIRDMSDLASHPFGGLFEGRPGEKEAFLKEQQRMQARIKAEKRQQEDLFTEEMKKLYGDVAWSLTLKPVEILTDEEVRDFAQRKASVMAWKAEEINYTRNEYNYSQGPIVSRGDRVWIEEAYPDKVTRITKWVDGGAFDVLLWKGRYMETISVRRRDRPPVMIGENCYEKIMILDSLTYDEEEQLKEVLFTFDPFLVDEVDQAREQAQLIGSGNRPVFVLQFEFPDGHCELEQLGVRTYPWKGYDVPKEFYVPDYSKPQGEVKVLDYRDVLYWAPVVQTDALGKAKLEFYNDDRARRLRVDVEGMTPQGTLGAGLAEIKIR